jgi:hypothetical protein
MLAKMLGPAVDRKIDGTALAHAAEMVRARLAS